ncbi:hypothetical protein HQ633_11420 [Enterococcus faecium]|nr:hypothetical protein [Enterococcus faecium]
MEIGVITQNEKRGIRASGFFFFSASWYQLANLAVRPPSLKTKTRNEKILVLVLAFLEKLFS